MMKKALILLVALAAVVAIFPDNATGQNRKKMNTRKNEEKTLADWVNPMIGTSKMGHTFPGACYPFGGVQLSPDTDIVPHNIGGVYQPEAYRYCAGYQYSDSTIVGFSHTHFSGTGHSDLGDVLIMPVTGPLKLRPGTKDDPDSGYRSRFSHDNEVARLSSMTMASAQGLPLLRGQECITILIRQGIPFSV